MKKRYFIFFVSIFLGLTANNQAQAMQKLKDCIGSLCEKCSFFCNCNCQNIKIEFNMANESNNENMEKIMNFVKSICNNKKNILKKAEAKLILQSLQISHEDDPKNTAELAHGLMSIMENNLPNPEEFLNLLNKKNIQPGSNLHATYALIAQALEPFFNQVSAPKKVSDNRGNNYFEKEETKEENDFNAINIDLESFQKNQSPQILSYKDLQSRGIIK